MEHQGTVLFIWLWRSFPLQPASWLAMEAQLIERLRFYVEEYFNIDSQNLSFEICLFAPEKVLSQFQAVSWKNTKVIPVDEQFSLFSNTEESPIIQEALGLNGVAALFIAGGDVEDALKFLVGKQTKSVVFSARTNMDVSYSSSVRIVPWNKISRLSNTANTSSEVPIGISASAAPLEAPANREEYSQIILDLRALVFANYFERLLRWGIQQQKGSIHAFLPSQFLFGEDPTLYSTLGTEELRSSLVIEKDPLQKRYDLILRGVSRSFINLRARIIQELIVDVINSRQVQQLVNWDAQHRLALLGSMFLLDREEGLRASASIHITTEGVFAEVLGLNPAVVERFMGMLLSLRPTLDSMCVSRSSLTYLDHLAIEDIHLKCSTYVDIVEAGMGRFTSCDDSCEIFLWGFDELLLKAKTLILNIIAPAAGSAASLHSIHRNPRSLGGYESGMHRDPREDSLSSSVYSRFNSNSSASVYNGRSIPDVYGDVDSGGLLGSRSLDMYAHGETHHSNTLAAATAGGRYSVIPPNDGLSGDFDVYPGVNPAPSNAAHYPRSVSGMSTSSTISSLTTRKEAIRKVHRGVYSFADREAGIFFFAFEQQFRDFLEKSFQVLVEETESGMDTRQQQQSNRLMHDLGYNNTGSYDAEPGNKNVVLKVSFYGNSPKNISSARTYLEQLNTTNLMRTQIYFPQVSAKKYKEILNKRASQSTILNNVRLREASLLNPHDISMSVVDPLRHKGFINIRVKPPMHMQGMKRTSQPSDVTVTISGSLLTEGNEQLIKDLESEFVVLDDEYLYQVVQIPYSHPMKRQLTIKSLREEIIQRHGLVALKWEEGCRANGSVGTAKIWARSAPSLEAILQEIRNAESLHLDTPALMGAASEGRSPIPVELEQDITKDIVTVLDINRTILTLSNLDFGATVAADGDLQEQYKVFTTRLPGNTHQAHMVVNSGANGEAKIVVYLPDLTLRYVLLGPPLSQKMSDMLARFQNDGIKSKYPYRDRTDSHAALLLEGEMLATTRAATEACQLITVATQELKSVHVMISDEQHKALLASDLALIKYIQGQVGVHLKLEPNIQDLDRVCALADLRFHYKPISVDSVADRAMQPNSYPWNTLPTMALARGLLLSVQYKMLPSVILPSTLALEVSVFNAEYGQSGWLDKVDTVVYFVFDGEQDMKRELETTEKRDEVGVTDKTADKADVKQDDDNEDESVSDAEKGTDFKLVEEMIPTADKDATFSINNSSFISQKMDSKTGKRQVFVRLSAQEVTNKNVGLYPSDVWEGVTDKLAIVAQQLLQALVSFGTKSFAVYFPVETKLRAFFSAWSNENSINLAVISTASFFDHILSECKEEYCRHQQDGVFTRFVALQDMPESQDIISPMTTFCLPESRNFPSSLDSGAFDILARVLIHHFEHQDATMWFDTVQQQQPSHLHPFHSASAQFGTIGDNKVSLSSSPVTTSTQLKMELLVANVPLSKGCLSQLMSTAPPVLSHGMKSFILKGLLPGALSGLDLLRAIVSPSVLVMKATSTSANVTSAGNSNSNNQYGNISGSGLGHNMTSSSQFVQESYLSSDVSTSSNPSSTLNSSAFPLAEGSILLGGGLLSNDVLSSQHGGLFSSSSTSGTILGNYGVFGGLGGNDNLEHNRKSGSSGSGSQSVHNSLDNNHYGAYNSSNGHINNSNNHHINNNSYSGKGYIYGSAGRNVNRPIGGSNISFYDSDASPFSLQPNASYGHSSHTSRSHHNTNPRFSHSSRYYGGYGGGSNVF